MTNERALKGHSPKTSEPLGYVSVAIEDYQKPVYNTSPQPRQSILIVWRRGSMAARMPKLGSLVLPHWRPNMSLWGIGQQYPKLREPLERLGYTVTIERAA